MKKVLVAIGLGLGLTVVGVPAQAQDHQYVGAKKCRTCHKKELIGNQYGKWKESAHAEAIAALKTEEAIEAARERGIAGPPHEAKECLKCHATAFGLEAAQMKYTLNVADGVQCESCHGPGADYRKKKIMSDRDKAVAAGLVIPDAETCVGCHNDESPSWDPTRYKLADGTTVGFDFEQAKEKIAHPIPEDVKGRYVELEKKQRAERRKAGAADEDDEDEEDE